MYFFRRMFALLPVLLVANTIFGQPTLTVSEEVSQTGHFQLQWQDAGEHTFELQQDENRDFRNARTIYEGPEKGRTMSGMLNGTYYYRVRSQGGDWSKSVKVTVQHYELSTAFMFLGLGAVVFFATATLIIRGHLKYRETHGASGD